MWAVIWISLVGHLNSLDGVRLIRSVISCSEEE